MKIQSVLFYAPVLLALLAYVPTPAHSQNGSEENKTQPSRFSHLKYLTDSTLPEPYATDLQRRIKRAWFPPKGKESKRMSVKFKLHKAGDISDLQISTTSGDPDADKAAMQAVENGAPFKTLPTGMDNIDLEISFDYSLFSGGGDRGSGRGRFGNF